jgi:hypothetical protein
MVVKSVVLRLLCIGAMGSPPSRAASVLVSEAPGVLTVPVYGSDGVVRFDVSVRCGCSLVPLVSSSSHPRGAANEVCSTC